MVQTYSLKANNWFLVWHICVFKTLSFSEYTNIIPNIIPNITNVVKINYLKTMISSPLVYQCQYHQCQAVFTHSPSRTMLYLGIKHRSCSCCCEERINNKENIEGGLYLNPILRVLSESLLAKNSGYYGYKMMNRTTKHEY